MKAKAAPRPLIAPTNWTGFYVGGFAGGAYGRTDIGFVGAPTEGSKPWVFGPLGGGQIGYNHQFVNNWVLGVEGDIGAATSRAAAPAVPRRASSLAAIRSASRLPTSPWKTAPTGWRPQRLGSAIRWGRTLYYVRGGGAWEDSTVSANCSLGPTAQAPGRSRICRNQALVQTAGFDTGNRTRTGWLIGFGTEFDLGKNWSAKTEYNYIDFGSRSSLASDGTTTLTDKATISQVKVGLNYRFSPTAIVAKY